MGPTLVSPDAGLDVGPHPHIGLQTVTWLVSGEILHKDSLDSEQLIRPGQVNLMTAGRGVVHAEEATRSYRGELHGVQLWMAQPETTRHGAAAFEHLAELPRFELDESRGTIITGESQGLAAGSRQDWPAIGIEGRISRGQSVWPLDPTFEYGLTVLAGEVTVEGNPVRPGQLAYLPTGREELVIGALESATIILIGGLPFESPITIWWNLVARSTAEIDVAYADWLAGRFAPVDSSLAAMPTPRPPWQSLS